MISSSLNSSKSLKIHPTNNHSLRVLVTGQSGLCKGEFLEVLQDFCNNKNNTSSKPGVKIDPDVKINEVILKTATIDHIYDLEYLMCESYNLKTPNYLDKPMKDLSAAKNETLKRIINESKNDKNTIIATHLTYLRKNSIYQILDWKTIHDFNPDMIITLIDDIHSIKKRIQKREDKDDYVRAMSLKDIAWWRESEISASKNLADNLLLKKIPHLIMAISHGPQILYQLMFESKYALGKNGKKIAYISYPMSFVKSKPDLKDEFDKFRSKLKEHYIVFDDGTIPEKALQDAFVENFNRPLPSGIIELDGETYQINDVLQVIVDINGQIITRDERLIDQSDMIVAYRPRKSIGSTYEVNYALISGALNVFVYHPNEDGQSPFATQGKVYHDLNQIMKEIPNFGDF